MYSISEVFLLNHESFYEAIFSKEDLNWKDLIYDLVKSENMDPWDIDMSVLSQKFLETLRAMKELDLTIPGKVILAAAMLLKVKSNKLLTEDIDNLDRLFAQSEESDESLLLDEEGNYEDGIPGLKESAEDIKLIPRTPQPRKRKVSVYDLIDALQKALDVKKRRVMRELPEVGEVKLPEKKVDITKLITNIYGKIKTYFISNKDNRLTFKELVPSMSKEDQVYTFIPLLHLTNQRKIDLIQEEHFGDIEVALLQKQASKQVDKELAA